MTPTKWRTAARYVLCLGLVLVISSVAGAQRPSEYQVKAAFLYNFANFVEFPI